MKVAQPLIAFSFVAALLLATTGLGLAQRAPSAASHVRAASPTLVKLGGTKALGKFLVNSKGLTLYHRVTESTGTISCTGKCLTAWPPLLLPVGMKAPTGGKAVTDKLGVISRPDISKTAKQVTYDGWPLYTWKFDKAPGQTTGQGIGKFFVVPPTPTVLFKIMITTTSGTTWGTVKFHYTYHHKLFKGSCGTASCSFSKMHAGVKVTLSQSAYSPSSWPFQGWVSKPADGGANKTSSASSLTVLSNDSYEIDANYVLKA
jgi:predicted lipoprotein with Yx(FWY)xxD motif